MHSTITGLRRSLFAIVFVAGCATPSLHGTTAGIPAAPSAAVPHSDGVAQPATSTAASTLLRNPIILLLQYFELIIA